MSALRRLAAAVLAPWRTTSALAAVHVRLDQLKRAHRDLDAVARELYVGPTSKAR